MLKGIVSSIEPKGIRVTFIDRNNVVSPPLSKAVHVGELQLGNNVVVEFFSDNMLDGLIIAKF
jgi:hypothetical protein